MRRPIETVSEATYLIGGIHLLTWWYVKVYPRLVLLSFRLCRLCDRRHLATLIPDP